MPRRKTFNKVNNDNVKIAHGRKARPKNKRVVPRKFEKPKTDNSFKQTLRQHVTVNVGGKDTEAEPKITKEQAQALIPRVQLARQLPSPEAGYNLFSALADKREAELKGLARHLEMLKGGTAYSRPQPTGRALLESLNAVADDQNALNAFLTPTQKPVPESPIYNSPDGSPARSGGGGGVGKASPATNLYNAVQYMKKYLLKNAQHLRTTSSYPTIDKWKERIITYDENSIGRLFSLYEEINRNTKHKGVEPETPNTESFNDFKEYMENIRKQFKELIDK